MSYEFFIGLRYLSSRRKQKFTSIIGIISVLGVIIGVMALNVVLAVMGDSKRSSATRYSASAPMSSSSATKGR